MNEGLKVLYIGEIVGKGGIFTVKNLLKKLKEEYQPDFIIANGEGATGGFGIGMNHSIYLHKLGIDVITSGEKVYYKKDMVGFIQKAPFILRPANYPPGNPGRGWKVFRKNEKTLAVINMLGQSGFNRVHLSNPFSYAPDLANRLKNDTPFVLMDFHACTTAEKYAMFFHMDGRVSAVIGSHTKAQTADNKIFPKGTGVICDAGRTGSLNSVGGLDPDVEIKKFLTSVPTRSQDAWENLELQGVFIKMNNEGKTEEIQRLRVACTDKPQEDQVGNKK